MAAVNDVATTGSAKSSAEIRWRRDRLFFTGMALAGAVAIFVGFAPSYYLKAVYGTPALPPLVHLHGVLFTSWITLLVVQTSLIAFRRTDWHRRLGVGGGVLAAAMTIVGLATAIGSIRRGSSDLGFLVVPMGSVVVFPALVGAALLLRRKTGAHKRLMLIATTELLTAGVGGWPMIQTWGPLGFFGATDLFVVALVIYDLMTRGRIHAATFWGGLFFIVSQPLRMSIAGTQAWLTFARWLTG